MKPRLSGNELVVILSVVLAVVFRNLFSILIALGVVLFFLYKSGRLQSLYESVVTRTSKAGKVSGNVEFRKGMVRVDNKWFAVLLLNDIPFDYRDFTEGELRNLLVSYNKVLDSVGEVKIVISREHVDKEQVLNNLRLKAQNLRVMVEHDPSNERAKAELRLVERLIKEIESGESPFKYALYFLVPGESAESVRAKAELLKSGLRGLGFKVADADEQDIVRLFEIRVKANKTALPSFLPLFAPFAYVKSPSPELISKGVLLGYDRETGRSVFWNVESSTNPHVLVIGPTGSGKTEFLISLGHKINTVYEIPVVFYDTKGDIKARLKRYGVPFKVYNPLIHGLGLLALDIDIVELKARVIEDLVSSAFGIDEKTSSIMYKLILKALWNGPSWSNVIRLLEDEDLEIGLKAYLLKVVTMIKDIDVGSGIDMRRLEEEKPILVVDLSHLASEEVKRLVTLTTIYSVYLYFRKEVDKKLRIALILDEAWTLFNWELMRRGVLMDVIKRGRGHGVAVLMATQNVSDFEGYDDKVLENFSTQIFMNNGDRKFWEQVAGRFVLLSNTEMKNVLPFLKVGEALVRVSNDPRPLIVRLDVLH